MKQQPRRNLSKAEIAAQAAHLANIEHQKTLVKLAFPFLQHKLSIYDAQTAVNAVAGFLKHGVEARESKIIVNDLAVDLKDQKDSPIKAAMIHLLEVFKDEKAIDSINLLQRLGSTLSMHSASEYMKQPMKKIDVAKFLA